MLCHKLLEWRGVSIIAYFLISHLESVLLEVYIPVCIVENHTIGIIQIIVICIYNVARNIFIEIIAT